MLTAGREEAEPLVKGFVRPVHKKFKTLQDAEQFMQANGARSANRHLAGTTTEPAGPSAVAYAVSAGPSSAPVPVPPPNHKGKGRNKGASSKRASPHEDVPRTEEHLWDVVYTDGACSNNGKGAHLALAGVGVWFTHGDPRCVRRVCFVCPLTLPRSNVSERCPGDQTNNRAELIVRHGIPPLVH